jgi:hypothetical protein
VLKSECQKSLAIARHSGEDDIKVELEQLGHEGVDWIDLARECKERAATVKTLIKFSFPKNEENLE